MKWKSRAAATMLLWIALACNNKQDGKDSLIAADVSKSKLKEAASPVLLQAEDSAAPVQNNIPRNSSPGRNKTQTKEDWDKKIIKTGELSVEVRDYAAFNTTLHTVVKRYGGYIAQEEQQQSAYKIEDNVTIKVPVDQFDEAVSTLSPINEKVVEKKITADDVTGELLDTKSRMEAKKRVRDRYLDLLKQAKNMEEILRVENEVNGIQENIEAAAGRIGYLDHAAAFSTIHIVFYQLLTVPGSNELNPSYGYRIMESFKAGLHGVSELLVVIAACWPALVIAAVAWYILRRRKSVSIKKTNTII